MSLKPIVKSAREALDRKDFEYALQLCTDALEFEPENYFLLVFRAMALANGPQHNLEAALQSYFKAARTQPLNPLAFQGIINLYESSSDLKLDDRYHSALQNLGHIFIHQQEHIKHMELTKKRLELYKAARNTEQCLEILRWLGSQEAQAFYKPPPSIKDVLVEQVKLLIPFERAQITKTVETARNRLGADPLAILVEKAEVSAFIASELTNVYRNLCQIDDSYVDELAKRLLRIVLSDYFEESDSVRENLAKELLSLLSKEHATSSFMKAIRANLKENSSSVALEEIISGPVDLFSKIKSLHAKEDHHLLLQEFEAFECCKTRWLRAFKLHANYSEASAEALKLYYHAMVKLNYFEEALRLLDKSIETGAMSENDLLKDFLFEITLQVFEHCRLFSRVVDLIEAKLMNVDPESPELIVRLILNLTKIKRYAEAREYISAVRSAYPEMTDEARARISFASGWIHWMQDNRTQECLADFLAAAKAVPSESSYFTWIGKFYWRMETELNGPKAVKCFSRALALCPGNLRAAILLAEIVVVSDAREQLVGISAIELLQSFTRDTQHSHNRRLFYYYGVALFRMGQLMEAANAMQNALKGSINGEEEDSSDFPVTDEMCLTWLAESFFRTKRFSSAAKAYQRLSNISENPAVQAVAQSGLAAVHLESSNYSMAVEALNSLSKFDSPKILFDKMFAGLSLARDHLRFGQFLSAVDTVICHLRLFQENFAKFNDCCEAWYVASESLLLCYEYREVRDFPQKELEELSQEFAKEYFVNQGLEELEQNVAATNCHWLVKWAFHCSITALSRSSSQLDIYWLQLGSVLKVDEAFLKFAQAAIINALKSTRSNQIAATAHHLLAEMSSEDLALKQHHLIRSLKLKESVPGWLKLARFYHSQGDWALAQEAYKRILVLEPESLEAAFELNCLHGNQESQKEALSVAQRALSLQPVQFNEQMTEYLVEQDSESELSAWALIYLNRRYGKDLKFIEPLLQRLKSASRTDVALKFIDQELKTLNSSLLTSLKLNYCSISEPPSAQTADWIEFLASGPSGDCRFLAQRPENEVAQSGWRGVVDGLLPSVAP